jgi:hypothetical protein
MNPHHTPRGVANTSEPAPANTTAEAPIHPMSPHTPRGTTYASEPALANTTAEVLIP